MVLDVDMFCSGMVVTVRRFLGQLHGKNLLPRDYRKPKVRIYRHPPRHIIRILLSLIIAREPWPRALAAAKSRRTTAVLGQNI